MNMAKVSITAPLISAEQFAQKILQFYAEQGRKDLPWQQNPTPYRVWVSEIMLQQTQVKTVIPYYQKFMTKFQSVAELAAADVDQVLHYWQGLGYYSRARNLHKCAQQVVNDFNGEFPDNLIQMQSLPGIGRSTAGAILSLAMQKPEPILDGNVKRVLTRVFMQDGWPGQAKVLNQLWAISEAYTPNQQTAQFNQAMMDLGASLCSRSKPQCQLCPLENHCLANLHGQTAQYPFKKPKKDIPTKQATFAILLNHNHQIQLLKRPPSGIWGGLWSLPEIESIEEKESSELVEQIKHTFSHFHLEMDFVKPKCEPIQQQIADMPALAWHNIDQLDQLAFPAPIKKFLFNYFQLN
jgi:A/G-specific adenine glycosylase